MRRSQQPQPHNHVRLTGKYKVKYTDPQEEFEYDLGMRDQPPQSLHKLTATLGLLEFPPRTILKNIQHTKNLVRRHCQIIDWFLLLLQDSDDEWVFDPDIDAILEAHGQKRTRDEAFSDEDDNVSDKRKAERGFDPRTSGLWAQHAIHCATLPQPKPTQFFKKEKKIAPARNRTWIFAATTQHLNR